VRRGVCEVGECLNAGLAATDARFVAKFDDDDFYGAHYPHDALLAISRGLVVFPPTDNDVAVRRADRRTHSWTISVDEYRTGTVRVAAGLALDRTMV
jgi:hypothetical protein